MPENEMTAERYIHALELTNHMTEKAMRAAIKEMRLSDNSQVLDIPCGIGNHASWICEENRTINVTGVDLSENHIAYARSLTQQKDGSLSFNFETGDINKLKFEDDSFDAVWCCDGLWPGPVELGCVAEKPYGILEEFSRVTKNGGTIAVLFWSGQKLLPGYPFLEALLNATVTGNRPFQLETDPELHIMRTPCWLEKINAVNIRCRTFTSDIQGPLNDQEKEALLVSMNMLWSNVKQEVPTEVWEKYQLITDPESDPFILDLKGYAGYITYTLFTAENNKG